MTGVHDGQEGGSIRLNSLGIAASVLDAMLDRLDAIEGVNRSPRKRTHARWPFRRISVELEVQHPGGSATRLKVATRNLSRGGVSVLHSMYLHSASRCTIHLPTITGEVRGVPGTIARCTHRGGRVHEVGLQFDQLIDLRHFYDRRTAARMISLERVDSQRLRGLAACCTRGDSEYHLIRSLLAETNVSLRRVDIASLAGVDALADADLLIIGQSQAGESGTKTLKAIRERGVGIGAVLLATDMDTLADEGFFDLSDVALAATPLTRSAFHATLAEILLVRSGAMSGGAGLANDDAVAWSARVAMQEMRDRIAKALQNDDMAGVDAACERLGECAIAARAHEVAALSQRACGLTTSANRGELASVLLRMLAQLDAMGAGRAA